jgi:uncharacterized protein YkwD
MRLRLPLLTAALAGALALPGAAQAAEPALLDLPCIEAIVSVGCEQPTPQPSPEPAPAPSTAPAPSPSPSPSKSCPGRNLIPTAANVATVRSATLCLLNEQRSERKLGRLKRVTSLEGVASAYAKRMVRERFFEHTSPDGGTFLSRIKRTSYLRGKPRRWSVGENIAWGTGTRATPEGIVQAWMASPGHKRNILNAGYTELGLGTAIGAPQSIGDGPAATYVNEFGVRHR